MGFLETIGQRRESRPQDSQPPAAQDLIWDDSASVPQRAPAPEPEPARSNRNDASVVWIAGFVVVVAIGVGAWLGIRNGWTLATPAAPAAADSAPAEEQAPVQKPEPPRPSARRREITRYGVNRQPAVETPASETSAAPAETLASETDAPVVNVADASASTTEAVVDSSPSVPAPAVPEDDFIYSNDGTGVTAPRLVSLGFPQPLARGFDTRTSALELIVSKSGTVERAKISPPSRNWEDAMLLSRAKSFQFVPAQRDGYPVRYRLVMTVETNP